MNCIVLCYYHNLQYFSACLNRMGFSDGACMCGQSVSLFSLHHKGIEFTFPVFSGRNIHGFLYEMYGMRSSGMCGQVG